MIFYNTSVSNKNIAAHIASRLSDSSRSRSFLDFQNDDNDVAVKPGAPVRGNGSWLPTLRPTLTKWNIIIKAAPREGEEEDGHKAAHFAEVYPK